MTAIDHEQIAEDLDDRLVDTNVRGVIAGVLARSYLAGPAKHTAAHEAADEVMEALLPHIVDALMPLIEADRERTYYAGVARGVEINRGSAEEGNRAVARYLASRGHGASEGDRSL